jgi:hypothetical protein
LSTWDIEKGGSRLQLHRIMAFLAFAGLAFLVNKIYGLFGHGVRSASMTWMFLYPLLGGSLIYLLIDLLVPAIKTRPAYRLFCNLHNAGLAALTVGSFLKGILDIAGAESPYSHWFFYAGWLLLAAGMALSAAMAYGRRLSKRLTRIMPGI